MSFRVAWLYSKLVVAVISAVVKKNESDVRETELDFCTSEGVVKKCWKATTG